MSKITLSKVAAPGTPAAGKIVLYFKSDGLLYKKDETGTETAVGGSGGGDFSGPASSVDGHVVLFNGATGKLGKSKRSKMQGSWLHRSRQVLRRCLREPMTQNS